MEFEVKQECLDLIRDISNAKGPSGFEDEVLEVARRYADGIGRIEEDHLRNLYIYRKENKGNRPVLQLDAHSDEVGFMVHSVRPNGTLRVMNIGGWNISVLPASKVLVRNADGKYLPGIIGLKPVHFQSDAERARGGAAGSISDLIIDVGATSYEDAVNNFHIRMGEPIVPATTFEYNTENDVMISKGFDCRIGCAVLIETLRRLEGEELNIDVVGTLSSQEEVGERGATVSVHHVNPDIAYVLEGCPADDTFTEPYAIQTALRHGPMFRFMDKSIICTPRYQRYVLDLAEAKNLPAQGSVREGGGNNAAIINLSNQGIPAVVAGVPVRYIHSMFSMTTYFDFEASVQVCMATLRSLNAETIDKF